MSLAAGTRLGPYEIVAPIGAGGMGEVYRARDTRLDREVAIKVSPEQFGERFEREAQAISSLNHPHICTLYDVGPNYLVMELVEGESPQGPMPINEALAVARQIVEALEAAHEKGITHRDLKPGNIKIKPDGTVKVLDFGLAKVAAPANPDPASSPTLAASATGVGVLVGTPAYMAPEQARGMSIDKRADIWAFGVVLYELLTGKRMFAGESTTDVLAAIVRSEPDWSALPDSTPAAIRRLLKRCVEKDRKMRLPDIGVARLEIAEAESPEPATGREVSRPVYSRRLWIALAGLAGMALASGFWWIAGRLSREKPAPAHLSITLSPQAVTITRDALGTWDPFAISPDGAWLAYVSEVGGIRHLFLRGIRESKARAIDGTEGAMAPFFSPDSRWVGFGTGGTMKKVAVTGGAPVLLCEVEGNDNLGGTWGTNGLLVFVPQFNSGLWTVPENGGTPRLFLPTDEEKDRIAYLYPRVLPGGKGILFSMMSGRARTADDFNIAVLEPGATEPRILLQGGSNARYVPETGDLVYVRGGALLSVPFDLSQLAVTSTPRSVTEGLERANWGYSSYSLSQTGSLVFEPERVVTRGWQLAVVDRKGGARPLTAGRKYPVEFSISPDGEHLVARFIAANDDLWIIDVPSGTSLPLTSEPPDEIHPQWTRDGTRIAFGTRTGRIFWKPADGTGPRELLSAGEYGRQPSSFSPDGKTLAFVETHPSTQRDIWLLAMDGDRKAQPFLNTEADEWSPKFSPDGRWLAYVSGETGRDEIYLRPVGAPGGRRQLSKTGGSWPVWGRNGELFFSRGDSIFSVLVNSEGNLQGPERLILESPKLGELRVDPNDQFYDVMPDGERFVVRFVPQDLPTTHLTIVLHWFEELTRR